MVQQRLDEVGRYAEGLRKGRPSPAKVMGREFFEAVIVRNDALDRFAQRVPGERGNAFIATGENRLIVRNARSVRAVFIRFFLADLQGLDNQPLGRRRALSSPERSCGKPVTAARSGEPGYHGAVAASAAR
jgi:hypothetical protein